MFRKTPLVGLFVSLISLVCAENGHAQSPTDAPPPEPVATAPESEVVTLPDNEKEAGKPNPLLILLSFLGLPRPGEHARPGANSICYFPTSSAVRDTFGDQWSFFAPAFGRLEVPQAHAVLMPEFDFVVSSRNGNRATLVPLGMTYTTGFGDKRTRGTIGVGTGLLLLESRVQSQNLPTRWRGGINGSVFAGVAFGGSGSLRVGYRWADKVRGFDLSGTSVEAAFRF